MPWGKQFGIAGPSKAALPQTMDSHCRMRFLMVLLIMESACRGTQTQQKDPHDLRSWVNPFES